MQVITTITTLIAALSILTWAIWGAVRWFRAIRTGKMLSTVKRYETPTQLAVFFVIIVIGGITAAYSVIGQLPAEHPVSIVATICFDLWIITWSVNDLIAWKREGNS